MIEYHNINNFNLIKNRNSNKLLSIVFYLDFDIYNIATEAYKDDHYHAAVVFSEALVKIINTKKNLEKIQYLKDFNLSYEMATRMYRKYRIVHDRKLLKHGPIWRTHRCNNEPFMSKRKSNSTIPDEVFEPILDRNTTFAFLQKYTKERIKNKRSIWNEMAVNNKVNQMRQFVAPLLQTESLCNGTQIRVRILVDILYVLE